MSGMRSTTISRLLNSPTSVQSSSVTTIASVVLKPYQTNSEITSAFASEAVEPTERSKPPTVSEIDTPTAITVTMAIDRRMLMILFGSRKLSEARPKAAISRITVSTIPHLYKNSNSWWRSDGRGVRVRSLLLTQGSSGGIK